MKFSIQESLTISYPNDTLNPNEFWLSGQSQMLRSLLSDFKGNKWPKRSSGIN